MGKPIDKAELIEKLKSMSVEERSLFREALQETDPDTFLSMGEVSAIREMLAGTKTKKKPQNFLDKLLSTE
jgi:hypothetical protein